MRPRRPGSGRPARQLPPAAEVEVADAEVGAGAAVGAEAGLQGLQHVNFDVVVDLGHARASLLEVCGVPEVPMVAGEVPRPIAARAGAGLWAYSST